MVKVGVISIDLIANTGKLLNPIKGAQRAIGGLSSGISKMGGGIMGRVVAPLAAMAAGFASAGAATAAVAKQFDEVDRIAKQADRLGVLTEKLIGLEHAGLLAGMSAEETGKALEFMLKKGKNVSDLDAIADRMAAIQDPAEKMQFALQNFGKSGAGMINVLSGGAAGLEAMQQDAEKLGLTLSRQDASKVEAAGDAFTRLKELISGVARRIAVELSPFITWLADSFVNAGTQGEGMAGKVRGAVDMMIKVIGWVLDAIDLIRTAFAAAQVGAQIALGWMVTGFAHVVKGIELAAESIANGFSWAFARAQQLTTEAISYIIDKIASVMEWMDSKLPESMRTGLGEVAREFADTFQSIAEQNRKDMEAQTYKVDFNLGGDTAMAFADAMQSEVDAAKRSFSDFANRENLSDKLKRNVERIRKEADEAAAEATKAPTDIAVTGQDAAAIGAVERGSQAAFKAIFDTTKGGIDKEQLNEQKKMNTYLERIEKGGFILKGANVS